MIKECGKCGEPKELKDFYINRAMEDGLTRWCKDCVKKYMLLRKQEKALKMPTDWKKKTNDMKAYQKAYRKKNAKKLTILKEKWLKENPERKKAYEIYKYALRKGTLIRKPCIICGAEPEYGHHTDYSKPLEVEWLCREHHYRAHRRLDRLLK